MVADGPIDLTQVSEEHERVALLRGDDVAWYTPARTLAAAVRGLPGSARTADNGRSIVWDHPTGVQARYTTDAGWTVTGPGINRQADRLHLRCETSDRRGDHARLSGRCPLMATFVLSAFAGAGTIYLCVYGTGWARRVARVFLVLSALDGLIDVPKAVAARHWLWAAVECLWVLALVVLLVPEQDPATERPDRVRR